MKFLRYYLNRRATYGWREPRMHSLRWTLWQRKRGWDRKVNPFE